MLKGIEKLMVINSEIKKYWTIQLLQKIVISFMLFSILIIGSFITPDN